MEYTEQYLQTWDDYCAKAANEYSGHVHALKVFEALSKDYMAALKMEYRKDHPGEKFSEAELETRVRASEAWVKFRNEQLEVLREAGRKEIAYENAKRRHQTAISGLAMRREEVRRFRSD